MTNSFGDAERYIGSLFAIGKQFTFHGSQFTVKTVGKPTCSFGEPKTDVYVLASSPTGTHEFKISFKKNNADFLENKINPERAEQLLGPNWAAIIQNATTALQSEFEHRPLIYKERHGHTEAGSITLGWKFELLNVNNGQLSGDMHLSKTQVIDVYAGTNLGPDKRNAYVNGRMIPNSGVANYILFERNRFRDIQEAADSLLSIKDYVDHNPRVYFACKALNYRTFQQRYDGNRPLAVYVDWSVRDGKLYPEIRFNRPLITGGDLAAQKLQRALRQLNAPTTNELNGTNVGFPSIISGSYSSSPYRVPSLHTRPVRNTPVHNSSQIAPHCQTPSRVIAINHPKPEPTVDLSSVKIGTTVYHRVWKKGSVTQISPKQRTIIVTFGELEKTFVFPDAFLHNWLKLTNDF